MINTPQLGYRQGFSQKSLSLREIRKKRRISTTTIKLSAVSKLDRAYRLSVKLPVTDVVVFVTYARSPDVSLLATNRGKVTDLRDANICEQGIAVA